MSKKGQRYSVKALGEDFASIFVNVVEALNDHEGRLQKLEKPNLKDALEQVLVAIGKIEVAEKSAAALEEFRKVCAALGVGGLEVSA